jgi:hypothetical protein
MRWGGVLVALAFVGLAAELAYLATHGAPDAGFGAVGAGMAAFALTMFSFSEDR